MRPGSASASSNCLRTEARSTTFRGICSRLMVAPSRSSRALMYARVSGGSWRLPGRVSPGMSGLTIAAATNDAKIPTSSDDGKIASLRRRAICGL